MLRRVALLLALGLLGVAGAQAAPTTLRLAAANTAAETGLIDRLVREFEALHPDIVVQVDVAGGWVVLDRARAGLADAVITHLPTHERLFIAEGYGLSRTLIMSNDFALLGPADDPLGLRRERDLMRSLRALAEAEVELMVPGERSGTYQKLAELWTLAGVKPTWIGFESTGASSASTLLTASAMGAYAFADMGTYLAHRPQLQNRLVPLYRDHEALRNFYSILVVNPARIPSANREAAERLRHFLASDRIQSLIQGFGAEQYQTAVFTAIAHLDPGLRAERAAEQIARERRNAYVASSLAAFLTVVLMSLLWQQRRARRLERRRQASDERFKRAVTGTNDGIWDWNLLEDRAFFSPRMLRILNIDAESTRFPAPLSVLLNAAHPDHRQNLKANLTNYLEGGHNGLFSTEFRVAERHDRDRWVMLRGKVQHDERLRPVRMSGSLTDISESKRQQAEIRYQALHDALTQLPNRLLLQDRLEQEIARSQPRRGPFALLMMDLDRFKEINDTLGHQIGDDILRQVAGRLKAVFRESDTIARLGGDEFAVLLPAAGAGRAKHVAEKIRLALKRSFNINHHSFVIGASVGIAMYPEHGDTADTLFRHADVAMYHAKRVNAGSAFYNVDNDPHSLQRLSLEKDLSDAIESSALELCYQPKLDLRARMLVGAEALVRWVHPQRGPVPADEIIELAENTGLINNLTYWVIDEVLRQAASWAAEGFYLPIGVNLSVWNVQDAKFSWEIENKLTRWKVLPDQLEFEITESAMIADTKSVDGTLERLSTIGIKLAVDDFGTGFSSLAYLKRLPVQTVKIDKSFVQNMHADESDRSIVRSTIEMAHNLGLNVVAEGVETEETLQLLCDLGCDVAQGYYVSRPLPPADLVAWASRSVWGFPPAVHSSPSIAFNSGKNRLH